MQQIEVVQFSRLASSSAFSIERVFRVINDALPSDISVRQEINLEFSMGVLPRVRDALRCRRLAGPVNHVVGDVHYLTYLLPRHRTILTIHDCEMIHRAKGLKRWLIKLFWMDLPLARAGHVVAISESTRDDIVRLTNRPVESVHVIANPIAPIFCPAPAPAHSNRPTVLHIGTKPNKNLERLIDAVRGLPLRLLVVGRPDSALAERLAQSGIDYCIRSDLADDQLLACYQEATMVAFVSLSEGFGLPILEAQAVQRPVLTSDADPMRSVAGPGGALLVDPYDVCAIRQGIQRLLEDSALRMRLVAAGRSNVVRFRSCTIASQYAELYRAVATQ